MNLKDLRGAFGATDLPSGLLQHLKNMSPFDLFKRRSFSKWRHLFRSGLGIVRTFRANGNGAGKGSSWNISGGRRSGARR